MDQDKLNLNQCSINFGTALHVALNNEDLTNAMRILRMIVNGNDFNSQLDLNKIDEDGNTPIHLVMKKFNINVSIAIKLA